MDSSKFEKVSENEGFNLNSFIFDTLKNEFTLTNLILSVVFFYFLYKLLSPNPEPGFTEEIETLPPPLPKQDMTLKELRQYDGTNSDKRICLAINRKIYDITKNSKLYGPNKQYHPLSGKDATRALASFNINEVKDDWDDYNGLSNDEWATVKEWEDQYNEKYDFVGNLIKEPIEKDDDIEEKESVKNFE